ncbi:MAG: ABC transporter substrate-binding protein, partial [Oscillospiraceae bacterium]|nr:ABC transporter substrate-binding protein [Oscillospiraceae bacterium]
MKRIVTLLLALALVLSLVACGGKTAETKTEEPTQSAEAEQPAATEEPTQTEQPAETQTAQKPQTPDPADQTDGETVTFTDDCGRTVEIPAEITRVVPTGGMAQVALFALAPEMFVGLASDWSEAAEAYVDPAYRDLPVLGALYGSA